MVSAILPILMLMYKLRIQIQNTLTEIKKKKTNASTFPFPGSFQAIDTDQLALTRSAKLVF